MGTVKLLAAVKGAITPVPPPDNPILVLELVHWYKVPATEDPVNAGRFTKLFPQ
jgi:hypothetical protein